MDDERDAYAPARLSESMSILNERSSYYMATQHSHIVTQDLSSGLVIEQLTVHWHPKPPSNGHPARVHFGEPPTDGTPHP